MNAQLSSVATGLRIVTDGRRLPDSAWADWRELVGRAVQRAFNLAGWSLKEAAAAIGRDPRQVARWTTGEERPQFDRIFAVEALRQPMLQALAEMTGARVEVMVTIRLQEGAA